MSQRDSIGAVDRSGRRFPRRATIVGALALVFSLAPVPSSLAVVPGEMNYQGLLLDDLGDPVTGTVEMVFTLFDAPTMGSSLWTETHAAVDVLDGVYQVSLGETTPLDAALVSGGSLYLEIAVDGGTLAPRQQLLVVPYALRSAVAEDAQQVDGLASAYLTEAFEHFAFDGGDPPNLDPSEGLGDVDSDGVPNFLDSDNDGDGLSDTVELAQASDINVVTPTLTGFVPGTADGWVSTSVQVQGTNFDPGLSVAFGSQNPAPMNVTPTSFDVLVGPQPPGNASVVVTLPNGQSDSLSFPFFYYDPTVTGFNPPTADGWVATNVQVQGTNFIPGLTVQFGSQNPTPTNITPTSFDVLVGPQPPGNANVLVTLPNGRSDASTFPFFYYDPVITGFTPPRLDVGQAGVVTIHGQNFVSGLTVQFGSQNPTPTNITPTSFDVFIAGTEPPGFVSVTVTLPNGRGVTDTTGFEINNRRVMFVTSQTWDGNLGGIAGADAKCNQLAQAAGLPGTFHAWLADSVFSPALRDGKAGAPYERVDGVRIADDWAALTDGAIDAPVNRDQNGTVQGGEVWSNVKALGAIQESTNHCSDWTSNSSAIGGRRGDVNQSSSQWTEIGTGSFCDNLKRLYCIEQ